MSGCTDILDDILVYGRDMAEHDFRLRQVLQRLADCNANLRVDKCVYGKPEVDFNDHTVSAAGIGPLQSNVDAIVKMPNPTDKLQLLRFMCTSAYYLKFVPRFADLGEPSRELLKKCHGTGLQSLR